MTKGTQIKYKDTYNDYRDYKTTRDTKGCYKNRSKMATKHHKMTMTTKACKMRYTMTT